LKQLAHPSLLTLSALVTSPSSASIVAGYLVEPCELGPLSQYLYQSADSSTSSENVLSDSDRERLVYELFFGLCSSVTICLSFCSVAIFLFLLFPRFTHSLTSLSLSFVVFVLTALLYLNSGSSRLFASLHSSSSIFLSSSKRLRLSDISLFKRENFEPKKKRLIERNSSNSNNSSSNEKEKEKEREYYYLPPELVQAEEEAEAAEEEEKKQNNSSKPETTTTTTSSSSSSSQKAPHVLKPQQDTNLLVLFSSRFLSFSFFSFLPLSFFSFCC
jgi:hypothetical protein